MKRVAGIVAAGAVLLASCQSWGPAWSELSGDRYYNLTTLNRRPAIIEKVDGNSAFASYPIKLEPGRHEISLQGPDPKRPGGGTVQTMTLDMQPCKRYFVNAQFKNNIEPDWAPVIDYIETLPGCRADAARK
jgi:hypothetical protein